LVEEAGGEGRGGNEAKRAVAGSSPEGMLVPVKTPRWDRDVYLYQASTSEAAGDLKQALASYQKVLAMEPKNFLIMNNVASILVRQGSNDEAICYAERAIAVKPRYVPALINLSIAYLQQGNRSEGESSLRRALTIEPANRLVLKNLGILMEKQDRFEEARSVYGKLAQLGDAQGYLGMARIAEKQDQKAEAVKAYQGLLQLDGISPAERALAGDRITMLTQ
jgi:tetratricopeptide (TPR) repeat protein